MDLTAFVLSWSPVLLLAVLAVGFKRSALELSIYGLGFTAGLAYLAFKTPLSVILLAGLDGVVTTAPLLLVVLAGILLSNLLAAAGVLDRLVAWFLVGLRRPPAPAPLHQSGDLQLPGRGQRHRRAHRGSHAAGRRSHCGRRPWLHFFALQDRHRRPHVRRPGAGGPHSAPHHPPGPGRLPPPRLDSLALLGPKPAQGTERQALPG